MVRWEIWIYPVVCSHFEYWIPCVKANGSTFSQTESISIEISRFDIVDRETFPRFRVPRYAKSIFLFLPELVPTNIFKITAFVTRFVSLILFPLCNSLVYSIPITISKRSWKVEKFCERTRFVPVNTLNLIPELFVRSICQRISFIFKQLFYSFLFFFHLPAERFLLVSNFQISYICI